MDFFAGDPASSVSLIQVCTDISDTYSYTREVRASPCHCGICRCIPLLLTFDTLPPRPPLPAPLRWQSAIAWLLGDELPRKPR